jgi:trans-aconitate methyltransferase
MEWDAGLYEKNHAFVAEYGKALMAHLPEGGDASVLDLGCGTGTLTAELKEKYRRVVGIDQSETMITTARQNHPGMDFLVMDALNMPFESEFDVVFSNAVFHWIHDQPRLLQQIYKALKKGGLLLCEFGAHGNIGQIWNAFLDAMRSHGAPVTTKFFYPTAGEYEKLLTDAGFAVHTVYEFERPTPLSGGRDGMRAWLLQFLAGDLNRLEEAAREDVIQRTVRALESTLWDGTTWRADYRRIRAVVEKQV